MRSAFAFVLLVLIGCSTPIGNFQTAAGKFLTSTAIGADLTMKGAATARVRGALSTNDWATVAVYYNQYRAYMVAATNAYNAAIAANDPSLFAPASNNLATAKLNLVNSATVPSNLK